MNDGVKRVNPIEGLMGLMSAQKDAILGGPDAVPGRDDVFRHEEPDGFIVDTCAAFDTHEWETGIYSTPSSNYTVVEQYPDREAAKIGHAKWVQSMTDDPEQELTDLNLWGL